ncbi:MAG: GspE/PulE family protein [Gemmataceae bacterium]|nr:GspE/PulE family protein [Gemmataceae bacterium]
MKRERAHGLERWALVPGAVWAWACLAAPAAAQEFPRGPGFYFNPYHLGVFLAAYLLWVQLCNFVDRDAQNLQLSRTPWNPLMVGLGAAGLLALWLVPNFWLGLPLFLVPFVAVFVLYARWRNEEVPKEERILTPQHWRKLAAKYLRLRFREEEKSSGPKYPIRFIGKSFDEKNEDIDRVKRVQESKGYKGALEMVYEAIQRRATDIHLEPTKDEMMVRLRIDGILVNADPFRRAMGDAVINIFKVLCNLDISEKRKPQDGSFSAQVEDRFVDFRVATAGSVQGEKMVIRILDKSAQLISLTQLGMKDRMRDQVRNIVIQPHGMFIVCGPTGAGKSTTLYAALNELDRYSTNIITVENPVEYKLDNITQIEVNPKAGKTFAGELRSILRQDPDVIMIGEIRDQETAEIACQAAQTGHMVFSTLHANDTVTALGRLLDLGVQPFMISSAISAILGQRLVRILCPECKVKYKPDPALLARANLPADKIKYFYRPPEEGERTEVCRHCGGTGYYKRTGIFELFVITDKIREMIRENPDLAAIKAEAMRNGMRPLAEDGLRQVIEGVTSINELLRVAK